jgi:hypothetical protein
MRKPHELAEAYKRETRRKKDEAISGSSVGAGAMMVRKLYLHA